MTGSTVSIASSLAAARARIAEACNKAGRDAGSVRIVAASKTQPAEAVREAIAAGIDAVGENRVQEGIAKRPLCPGATPWHLIGPLQRNKVRQAHDAFDCLETLDRVELADRLETLLAGGDRIVPVLIEVNIGGETQKSGIASADAPALGEHVLANCPHLRLAGLMTVPPYDPDPERARPHFAGLRELAGRIETALGVRGFELSMGMSEDYAVAVEEGATWVRLGRVLFGQRRPRP
jgi:PLP dependent protein